jgi:hypothetical protein
MKPYNLRHERFRSYNWEALLAANQVDEITLEPDAFVSAHMLKGRLKHQYYNEDSALNRPVLPITVNQDPGNLGTLLWYAPDCGYPPLPGRDRLIAGLYLRNVIPPDVQKEAFDALHAACWEPVDEKRPEVRAGKERQAEMVAKGLAPEPGELNAGYSNNRNIEQSRWERDEPEKFSHLGPLLQWMDRMFEHALPEYHKLQNLPITWEQRERELQKKGTRNEGGVQLGGIPLRFRALLTSFSTIALLRSCPTAIHTDANARNDQLNFSCITSVTDPAKPAEGGTFALIEYGIKIPIRSGDLLIAQTSREWHTNIGPVQGEKYSIVAYYKTNLRGMKLGPSMLTEEVRRNWEADWPALRLKQHGLQKPPGKPQRQNIFDEYLAYSYEQTIPTKKPLRRLMRIFGGVEAIQRQYEADVSAFPDAEVWQKYGWSPFERPCWPRCPKCQFCHYQPSKPVRGEINGCPTEELINLIEACKRNTQLQRRVDSDIVHFLQDLQGFCSTAKVADALGVTPQYVGKAKARYLKRGKGRAS